MQLESFIGRAPASEGALEQLKLLILLLLGCAVQGPTKEVFITRIKELDVDAQHDIVECIKQVSYKTYNLVLKISLVLIGTQSTGFSYVSWFLILLLYHSADYHLWLLPIVM